METKTTSGSATFMVAQVIDQEETDKDWFICNQCGRPIHESKNFPEHICGECLTNWHDR